MNEKALQQLEANINLRGLSSNTANDYVKRTGIFLRWADKPAESLGEQDIAKFLTYLINERKLKPGTVNGYNAALRFFFGVTMNRNLNYKQVPRQKQRRRIPIILSKEELTTIFDACDNLRDKALLMTCYGSGLRLSELTNLRVKDIDSKSMRIFVYKGKGDRDRFTVLSQTNLELLREYWKRYRPKNRLFLTKQGTPVTSRCVQDVFHKYCRKAGIIKPVSIHSLRHAFATHLLENGVSVIHIKQLLGHTHIQSTTFYLNVANIETNMKSPLDTFNLPEKRNGRGRPPKTKTTGVNTND
jgi:site-specific recombinase XerD